MFIYFKIIFVWLLCLNLNVISVFFFCIGVIFSENVNVLPATFCYFYVADYWDVGDPIYHYSICKAWFWCDERLTASSLKDPKYSKCCLDGKIKLARLEDPPK